MGQAGDGVGPFSAPIDSARMRDQQGAVAFTRMWFGLSSESREDFVVALRFRQTAFDALDPGIQIDTIEAPQRLTRECDGTNVTEAVERLT